jgi:integrin beta 3
VKAFTLKWPTMIYRGVFKDGEQYEAGDAVTWGGHVWIAERATGAKPDQPDQGWRLAVKRGARGPAALTTEPVKL